MNKEMSQGDRQKALQDTEVETTIRVASECHAIFRIIDPNETETTATRRAIFHIPSFPSVEAIDPAEKLYEKREEKDADMVELLLCIDWKINLLIKTLAPIQDADRYPYQALILEIGMKEIKVSTVQPLERGTLVEFHFVLPILPFKEIFLTGEVVRLLPTPEAYDVAVSTQSLNESEREHFIRYIVKRQFQLKREHA